MGLLGVVTSFAKRITGEFEFHTLHIGKVSEVKHMKYSIFKEAQKNWTWKMKLWHKYLMFLVKIELGWSCIKERIKKKHEN